MNSVVVLHRITDQPTRQRRAAGYGARPRVLALAEPEKAFARDGRPVELLAALRHLLEGPRSHVRRRELLAVRDGQHRNLGALVVGAPRNGERPEVRRRPHEDDQEQHHRRQVDAAGRGRPADHRREGAGGAADDDVLRRAALEPHGVNHAVDEQMIKP